MVPYFKGTHWNNADRDQDSDISFMNDTDEEIDTREALMKACHGGNSKIQCR